MGDLGVFCVMIFVVIGCCWTAGWFWSCVWGVVWLASLSAQNIPLIVLHLGNIYTISGYQDNTPHTLLEFELRTSLPTLIFSQ